MYIVTLLEFENGDPKELARGTHHWTFSDKTEAFRFVRGLQDSFELHKQIASDPCTYVTDDPEVNWGLVAYITESLDPDERIRI